MYSLTLVVKSHFHIGSNNAITLFLYNQILPQSCSASHETENANAVNNVVNNDNEGTVTGGCSLWIL